MKPEPRDVLVEIERAQALPAARVHGFVARELLRPLASHPTEAEREHVLRWLRTSPHGTAVALQVAAKRKGQAPRKGSSFAGAVLLQFAEETAKEIGRPRPLDASDEALTTFEEWLSRSIASPTPKAGARKSKLTAPASPESVLPGQTAGLPLATPADPAGAPSPALPSKALFCILALGPPAVHSQLVLALLRRLAPTPKSKGAPSPGAALIALAMGAARKGTLPAAIARALLAGSGAVQDLCSRAEEAARSARFAAASNEHQLMLTRTELAASEAQRRDAEARIQALTQAVATLNEHLAASGASLEAAHESARRAEAFWKTELPRRIGEARARMAHDLETDLAETTLALEGSAPNVPMALRRLARIRQGIQREGMA